MNTNLPILQQYLFRTSESSKLTRVAREALPGGIVTDTRYFEPYGIYVDRALGVHKWDVDGNRYLDFFGGHGANMLGHSHPVLVDAVTRAIALGVQFAANQPTEIHLAQKIQRLMPSAERVRFTSSGTEATMLALQLARAFTGRRRIVRFASHYHGWHDHAVSGYLDHFDGTAAPGILPEVAANTILLRANDKEALEESVDLFGPEIAAFIVEPVGTHFGVVPTSASFVEAIQAAARACGALFILDEVLSGFRVSLGGAQSVCGLRPDLTTLAKVLCGGMPGGAVAGRSDVLDQLGFEESRRCERPKVMHQGTFAGNPISMSAGIAVLTEIEKMDGCAIANRLGSLARSHLNEMAEEENLPFSWYGEYSAFHMLFHPPPDDPFDPSRNLDVYLARPPLLANRFRMAMNNLGVDLNTRCSGLLSAIHSEDDVNTLVSAAAQAGRMVRKEGLI